MNTSGPVVATPRRVSLFPAEVGRPDAREQTPTYNEAQERRPVLGCGSLRAASPCCGGNLAVGNASPLGDRHNGRADGRRAPNVGPDDAANRSSGLRKRPRNVAARRADRDDRAALDRLQSARSASQREAAFWPDRHRSRDAASDDHPASRRELQHSRAASHGSPSQEPTAVDS